MPNDPHLLASLEQVRGIIGPEVPAIRAKFFPAPNLRVSFGKLLAKKLGAGEDVADQIDAAVAEDYRTGL